MLFDVSVLRLCCVVCFSAVYVFACLCVVCCCVLIDFVFVVCLCVLRSLI